MLEPGKSNALHPMADPCLIVFLKAPRPGAVKTRLAKTLGAPTACGIYQHLVTLLLRKLASMPHVELRFTPDDARCEIEPWAQPNWRLEPQGPGDLGTRLHEAFTAGFQRGSQRVLAIGSDCPELEPSDLDAAWMALLSHDVVLGPARDGGYWLIGLRAATPELFEEISWGSDAVLSQTLERCRHNGLRFHLLRELEDIDTEEAWRRYLGRQPAEGVPKPDPANLPPSSSMPLMGLSFEP